MDVAMRALLQWDQTNSNNCLCAISNFLTNIREVFCKTKTLVKLSHMLQIRNPGGHFVFSSYFSFLQTSKTSLRSVRLNSPPELGSKKTLHLFIIFFIFANIQNFQKIRLCYIVPQNWGLVEHFRFWPWSSFCKHAKLRLNVMLIFNMKVLIKILLWACSSFKIIKKIRFKQFNPSILELLRSTNTTESTSSSFKY